MMPGLTRPLVACLIAMLLLAACAGGNRQSELERMQYVYSAAVRWGDFEGAWNLVDPDYREQNPMSDLQFKRYEQVRISAYRELASQVLPDDTALREIEIGVINRHNQAERTLRYTEQWRYDPQSRQWWITGGLPDLWAGE